MNQRHATHNNQSGLVSIIVTIIIMFILSVTVMSFATVMRREQRQVLDRQLNTQAFYAAESGINDAVAQLKALALSDPSGILTSSYTTTCKGTGSFEDKINNTAGLKKIEPKVTADGNVSYSCLLVDPRPPTLEYKSVDRNPRVVPVRSGGGAIDTVVINWQAADGNSNFSCPGSGGMGPVDLSSNTAWMCGTGLMRIDLVPTPSAISRDSLNSSVRTMFLYPVAGGIGTGTMVAADTGRIAHANCTASPPPNTKFCTVRISVSPAQNYYMRMSSIYKTSSVTISALSGGSPVPLVGAQAMIDSTGKANDILRRLQVRVAINPFDDSPFPLGAIESVNTLCKQFSVIPNINTVSSPGGECGIN